MFRLLNAKSLSLNSNSTLRCNQLQNIQCRGIKSANRKVRVVLFEDVKNLGVRGEEVLVNPGRARNHLVNSGIAGYYTTENRLSVPYPSLSVLQEKEGIVIPKEEVKKGIFHSRLLIIRRRERDEGINAITSDNLSEKIWKQFRMEIPPENIVVSAPLTKIGNYLIGVVREGKTEDLKVKVVGF